MGQLIHAIQWLTGLIFLPAGLALLKSAPVSGLFLAAAGALILPPSRNAILSRVPLSVPRIGKIAGAVGLVFASMVALPSTPADTALRNSGTLPSPDIVQVTVVVTATPGAGLPTAAGTGGATGSAAPSVAAGSAAAGGAATSPATSGNRGPAAATAAQPTVTAAPPTATRAVQPTATRYVPPTATLAPPTPTWAPPTAAPTAYIQQFAPVGGGGNDAGAGSGGGFSCNCGKTCGQMSSCAEAQYQLNVCGCGQRDADNDGIACDSDCQ